MVSLIEKFEAIKQNYVLIQRFFHHFWKALDAKDAESLIQIDLNSDLFHFGGQSVLIKVFISMLSTI